MKTILALILFLFAVLLSGCGNGENNNNHGYGYDFDIEGQSGTKLRYHSRVPSSHPLADIGIYETAFVEVQQCTNIYATGSFIILSVGHLPDEAGGMYFRPNLIVIALIPDIAVIPVTKHEFVHYLLDQSGFPWDRNMAHDSPLFNLCAPDNH